MSDPRMLTPPSPPQIWQYYRANQLRVYGAVSCRPLRRRWTVLKYVHRPVREGKVIIKYILAEMCPSFSVYSLGVGSLHARA